MARPQNVSESFLEPIAAIVEQVIEPDSERIDRGLAESWFARAPGRRPRRLGRAAGGWRHGAWHARRGSVLREAGPGLPFHGNVLRHALRRHGRYWSQSHRGAAP